MNRDESFFQYWWREIFVDEDGDVGMFGLAVFFGSSLMVSVVLTIIYHMIFSERWADFDPKNYLTPIFALTLLVWFAFLYAFYNNGRKTFREDEKKRQIAWYGRVVSQPDEGKVG